MFTKIQKGVSLLRMAWLPHFCVFLFKICVFLFKIERLWHSSSSVLCFIGGQVGQKIHDYQANRPQDKYLVTLWSRSQLCQTVWSRYLIFLFLDAHGCREEISGPRGSFLGQRWHQTEPQEPWRRHLRHGEPQIRVGRQMEKDTDARGGPGRREGGAEETPVSRSGKCAEERKKPTCGRHLPHHTHVSRGAESGRWAEGRTGKCFLRAAYR